jgi:hypothetical protein
MAPPACPRLAASPSANLPMKKSRLRRLRSRRELPPASLASNSKANPARNSKRSPVPSSKRSLAPNSKGSPVPPPLRDALPKLRLRGERLLAALLRLPPLLRPPQPNE